MNDTANDTKFWKTVAVVSIAVGLGFTLFAPSRDNYNAGYADGIKGRQWLIEEVERLGSRINELEGSPLKDAAK